MNHPAQPIRSVVVVGSGNVAEALARVLKNSPFELRQVFARNPVRGPETARTGHCGWTDDRARLAVADLYIVAVSDRAVAEVAGTLSFPPGAAVVHTAGAVPLEALPALPGGRGVLYPFQTFTRGRAVEFAQVPLFIEASDTLFGQRLETFARGLSRTVLGADSARRARIHVAGVFACNFVNALYGAGERVLREAGLPYDLLRPLIGETAAKALDATAPAAVQTGPAVRGDRTTQQRHLALLAGDPALETIYKTISEFIWEISRKT